ncbi:MAG TPA: TylF/MycF/NovP-related O-methyltransferase [Hyphomicrobiaceae bacterium]|nr:TylF/MycF/NovP-related O-methyltransferase [Hyphomicrobiaceae bacterium]
MKKLIHSVLRHFGYRLEHLDQYQPPAEQDDPDLAAALHHCQMMRDIHRQDAVEIEALYREFVFPDLPKREGREVLLNDLVGTTISEAIYVLHSLHQALRIPGDICEFGVAQGATSRLLAAEILPLADRTLWLFDSFEGLPEPTVEDRLIDDIFNLGSMDRYKGTMASPESLVLEKLTGINFPLTRTKVKKGWIKETSTTGDLPKQIAFAYLDFDLYEPIRDGLDFIDPLMPAGGRIVVDDYGFFSEGAQLAVDQFVANAAGRYELTLPLPLAGHFCLLRKID